MFRLPRPQNVLPDLDRCPCCNRALVYVDGASPSRARRNSTQQVSVAGFADPLYRQCPHCDARWHRYPRRHPLRSAATAYVDEWPAHHFRSVESAWADGVIRVAVQGQLYDLRRVAAADDVPAEPLASDQPVYVVTAWNQGGVAATLTSNQTRQTALESEVRRLGWASCPAGSYDVDFRWAERAIAVSTTDEADVLALARRFEQPAVQRWYDSQLSVLATETGALIGEPTATVTTRVDRRICPMRALKGDPQEDEVCRDPGGPWVSASIHESLRWRCQREVLLDALCCDVCRGGPPQGRGRPIAVYPQLVASRYGPARAAK